MDLYDKMNQTYKIDKRVLGGYVYYDYKVKDAVVEER